MLFDILQYSPVQIGASIIIIFIAYSVKGLSGFGSGLVAIPLLAFIFPLSFIVPTLGLLSYSGTVLQSYQLRKQVSWSDLLPLLPFSLLGITMAVWLLVNVDSDVLVLLLGVFVLFYSVYSLFTVSVKSGSRRWAVIAGCGGGLVGALFGTGGPFYVVYLKLRQLDKHQFRATISMIFLIDGGVRIFSYAQSDLYNQQTFWLFLILFPVLLLGMYIGNHMHMRLDQKKFNLVISLMLMVSGVLLIVKTLVS